MRLNFIRRDIKRYDIVQSEDRAWYEAQQPFNLGEYLFYISPAFEKIKGLTMEIKVQKF